MTIFEVGQCIGGDSIEARRHVPPHFFRAGGTQWSVPLHFLRTENIRHAHIEPYTRDRQIIFYICFVSSHDSTLM